MPIHEISHIFTNPRIVDTITIYTPVDLLVLTIYKCR